VVLARRERGPSQSVHRFDDITPPWTSKAVDYIDPLPMGGKNTIVSVSEAMLGVAVTGTTSWPVTAAIVSNRMYMLYHTGKR